jgi:hypothetical protein
MALAMVGVEYDAASVFAPFQNISWSRCLSIIFS